MGSLCDDAWLMAAAASQLALYMQRVLSQGRLLMAGMGTHTEVCLMYSRYILSRSGRRSILSSVSLVTCTMQAVLKSGPTNTHGAPTLAPNSASDHQNSCSKK